MHACGCTGWPPNSRGGEVKGTGSPLLNQPSGETLPLHCPSSFTSQSLTSSIFAPKSYIPPRPNSETVSNISENVDFAITKDIIAGHWE